MPSNGMPYPNPDPNLDPDPKLMSKLDPEKNHSRFTVHRVPYSVLLLDHISTIHLCISRTENFANKKTVFEILRTVMLVGCGRKCSGKQC
jgi:hypothetical protein